MIEIAILSHSC